MHLLVGLPLRDLAEQLYIHHTMASRIIYTWTHFPTAWKYTSMDPMWSCHFPQAHFPAFNFQLFLMHKWCLTALKYIVRLHPLSCCKFWHHTPAHNRHGNWQRGSLWTLWLHPRTTILSFSQTPKWIGRMSGRLNPLHIWGFLWKGASGMWRTSHRGHPCGGHQWCLVSKCCCRSQTLFSACGIHYY